MSIVSKINRIKNMHTNPIMMIVVVIDCRNSLIWSGAQLLCFSQSSQTASNFDFVACKHVVVAYVFSLPCAPSYLLRVPHSTHFHWLAMLLNTAFRYWRDHFLFILHPDMKCHTFWKYIGKPWAFRNFHFTSSTFFFCPWKILQVFLFKTQVNQYKLHFFNKHGTIHKHEFPTKIFLHFEILAARSGRKIAHPSSISFVHHRIKYKLLKILIRESLWIFPLDVCDHCHSKASLSFVGLWHVFKFLLEIN